MSTNIVLDDDIIREAQGLTSLKTKEDVVDLALLRRSQVRPHQLSFPQAKRFGNTSENKERFRTRHNDRIVDLNVALLMTT